MQGFELVKSNVDAVKTNVISKLAKLGESPDSLKSIANEFDKNILLVSENHISLYLEKKNSLNARKFIQVLQSNIENPNSSKAKTIPNEIRSSFYSLNVNDRIQIVDKLTKRFSDNLALDLKITEDLSKENNNKNEDLLNRALVLPENESEKFLQNNPQIQRQYNAVVALAREENSLDLLQTPNVNTVYDLVYDDAFGDRTVSLNKLRSFLAQGLLDKKQFEKITNIRDSRRKNDIEDGITVIKQTFDEFQIETLLQEFQTLITGINKLSPSAALKQIFQERGQKIIEQNSDEIIRIKEQISKTELEIKNLPKDDNYLANRRDKDRKIRRSNSKIEKLENANREIKLRLDR